MTFLTLLGLFALACTAAGQQQNYLDYDYQDQAPQRQPSQPPQRSYSRPSPPLGLRQEIKPTPVPILKQINRHNDDGSYTYGYEGADGSFKIETKLPTGEVTGKYGYVDPDTGKLRVVDYGANKYGFQPAGEGITVAPPTLVDETTRKDGKTADTFAEYDDGSYFEPAPPRPAPRPSKRVRPANPIRLPVHQPQRQQYVSYEGSQPDPSAYAPRPAPPQPQQVRHASPAPVPPRAVIPGAAPVGPSGPVYKPQTFSAPAPVKPVREPIRDAYPRGSSSILDQLSQQYALPQGSGQPLHDISFGSYSSRTHF